MLQIPFVTLPLYSEYLPKAQATHARPNRTNPYLPLVTEVAFQPEQGVGNRLLFVTSFMASGGYGQTTVGDVFREAAKVEVHMALIHDSALGVDKLFKFAT